MMNAFENVSAIFHQNQSERHQFSGENVSKSCVVFPQLNILSVIILVQIINLSRAQ